MCGARFSLCLALSLLLCSALSWADDYPGPPLPAGWYPISEAELTELETTLDRQALTIERQRQTLTQLSGTISQQASTIERLGTSFREFEHAVQATLAAREREARALRWVAVGLGGALLVSLIF